MRKPKRSTTKIRKKRPFALLSVVFHLSARRVNELERTRPDGNIVKITEYDLSGDNFNPKISDAVRTHSEKLPQPSRQSFRQPQAQRDSRLRSTPSPKPER